MGRLLYDEGGFRPGVRICRAVVLKVCISALLLSPLMCRAGEVTQDIELFGSFAYGPCEDPAPAHELDYFLGLDTTFATSTFLSSDLEPFPSLAGQSGNLILTARVPAGREIVVARDCTMDIRFGWNPCSCSTTNGSVRPATVVELLGAFGPPPTGGQTLSTFEAPSGSAPPELGNVLIQYSAEVTAGFRFSGIRYTIPIDQAAATFPTIGPLAGPSESRIQCVRILPGDQRATEGDPVAVFSLLPVNIALTQVQPLPGVEVLTSTCATYQLEFAEDTGVSPVWSATGAAAEGNGEIQVLSDASGETGSKSYRVVVTTE